MSLWNRMVTYPRALKELQFAAWRWPALRPFAEALISRWHRIGLIRARTKSAGTMSAMAAGLVIGVVSTSGEAQLVPDGGFEQPNVPYVTNLVAPAPLGAWNVVLGSVDTRDDSTYDVDEGHQFLFLNGQSRGAVEQTIATVPGQRYAIKYYLSGDPVQGSDSSTMKPIRATFDSETYDYSFNTQGHSATNMGWYSRVFHATATSSTTTLRFESLNQGNGGPAVDHVRIELPCDARNNNVLADSMTDFSGTQGQCGWYYGFYDGPFAPSDFQLMPLFTDTNSGTDYWHRQEGGGGYWTLLEPVGGHPNGITTSGGRQPVDNWAVRRWVSSFTGPVTIDGRVRKTNIYGSGDTGIIGHVFVNSLEVWSTPIGHIDDVGVTFSLPTVIAAGDTIDFAIDPSGSHDLSDSSEFSAVIRQPCPGRTGDMNSDGPANGGDLQAFTTAYVKGSSAYSDTCPGDFNNSGIIDDGDVVPFVNVLLAP